MRATVLIIDDDKTMLVLLESLVESWGQAAVVAASGEEGLARLRDTPIDLVLTDIRMPGMSGEEVLAQVRKTAAGIPVILMTAHGSVKAAVEAMKKGAFDYVLKPVEEDEFRLTVDRALEHTRLRRENDFLRAEAAAGGAYGDRLVGDSPKMLQVFDLMDRVARTDSTVLITGETGTGKELVARTIHLKSARAARPLMACNCAALNPNLLESELFGHEKGAFTGAVATRRGRFEMADGGTLFLDEIGETAPEFQAKLLRVLQERELERVGGSRTIKVDVRVIASTNRDLGDEVKEGRFRQDLYYRLKVVPVHVPPLRERPEDVLPLAEHFLGRYREQYGSATEGFSKEAGDYLLQQEWEGNVRELQHRVERAVVLSSGAEIGVADLRFEEASGGQAEPADRTLQGHIDRQTSDYVIQVLDSTNWQKQRAADLLGVDRATLYRMIKKYKLERGES